MSDKHDLEEDYFKQIDREKKAALKKKMDEKKAAQAKLARAELHHDHCGKCGGTMSPKMYKGVEIDICGDCGAVLLDPGELEILAGEDKPGMIDSLAELLSFSKRRGEDEG